MPKIMKFEGNGSDKHAPFITAPESAKKGELIKVTVQVGKNECHPDSEHHFISYIQLWDGNRLVAQANFEPKTFDGNCPKVDFYMTANKKLKLTAYAYCTLHGVWESDTVEVEVSE